MPRLDAARRAIIRPTGLATGSAARAALARRRQGITCLPMRSQKDSRFAMRGLSQNHPRSAMPTRAKAPAMAAGAMGARLTALQPPLTLAQWGIGSNRLPMVGGAGSSRKCRFSARRAYIRSDIELGYWFIALAAITWSIALVAMAMSGAMSLMLLALASGATILAIGELTGTDPIRVIGGYFLIAAAVIAWYTAIALMIQEVLQREVLPLWKTRRPAEVAPGIGEPGVMRGQ